MAKEEKKDAAAIVLRPFRKNGTKYSPDGPNAEIVEYDDSDLEGENPRAILPSKLKGLSLADARAQGVVERTIAQLEKEIEAGATEKQKLEALIEELKVANEDLKRKLEAAQAENVKHQQMVADLKKAAKG